MAEVILKSVTKRYGATTIIENLDLEIRDREFMVLVGPSGCGKSTALRMVAGLEEITAGTVSIGGRVVNEVAPKDRDIAMVFQSYALYPHMSVRENLEFGLKMRKMPKAEIDGLVSEAADVLDIVQLLDRKPRQLSGGQRQRVAVGRAIVRKPSVFLFDEPLSNLDAKLRVQMRAEITRLQKRLQTTTIYVTHDQVEAMTMGDRIAVMKSGVLHQVGSPLEVYETPTDVFVAQFIGTPPMNFFAATIRNGGASLEGETLRFPVPPRLRPVTSGREGLAVLVGIRPEHLHDTGAVARGETCTLRVNVDVVEPLGHEAIVHARIGRDSLIATMDPHRAPRMGDVIDILVELESLHLFDAATERRLATPAS